jgi:FtsP/CotA-like multicopper oxidase with cupredoxin domain
MGAGMGPDGTAYPQNRATLHLHGGATPWISDGTAHQWITPAGETSTLKKGLDARNVPDMPAPGQGSQTFYWTNQQSGRLMFFHDHAYGITRLNVYAGEAAGYLLVDPAEEDALKAAGVPGTIPSAGAPDLAHLIPLVIQDKTFVANAATPTATDPTRWTKATDPLWSIANWGGGGSLWFPHVYQPESNAGRWRI